MGKGAALLGLCPVRQGQGGGLCATCGPLRGVCKRGLGCETPRPHTSGARAIWRFLSPHPENRGYRKHSHPHRWTSEEKPPAAVVPAGKLDSMRLGTGPLARPQRCSLLCACAQADLGLPRRGQGPGPSQASASAHQLFPRPGRALALLCLL